MACGNPDRGDDGLGWAAVEPLLATLPPDVLIGLDVRHGAELRVEDLLDLPAGSTLVIVDAVSGVEPGSVVRRSLAELAASAHADGRPRPTPRSSHQLPIELVLGLAETLLGRPITGTFVGLGGGSFGFEPHLSTVVHAALPALRIAVAEELARLAAEQVPARTPTG